MEKSKKLTLRQIVDYVIKNASIFLALMSGYMYICAYTYEHAYLEEFGISSAHLTLDINTILRDGTRLIGIIVIFTGSYYLLVRILKYFIDKSKAWGETIKTIIIISITLFLARIYFPVNGYLFFYVFSIVGILYILILVTALLKGVFFKIGDRQKEYYGFSENRKDYYGFDRYYIFIFLFIINPIFICQLLGQGEAFRQHNFDVIHDSIDHVIIRKYGDEMICKDLTRDDHATNKISLIKLTGDKAINVVNMEIGYISMSNVEESNFVTYIKNLGYDR